MLEFDVCEFGGQLLELMWLTVCYRDIMADKNEIKAVEDDVEDEVDLNYRAPEKKSLQEIQELDKDDESLQKYKQALLGNVPAVVDDPHAPNVQVLEMELICSEAPEPLKMNLTGNVASLKDKIFVMKEGSCYRVKICFKVVRDIVSGLKYIQHTYRKGIKVDKDSHMVGSYGPRCEPYEYLTPMEEAPKGMLVRGSYNIKSWFTDDDKTNHMTWEWNMCIKKDWKE